MKCPLPLAQMSPPRPRAPSPACQHGPVCKINLGKCSPSAGPGRKAGRHPGAEPGGHMGPPAPGPLLARPGAESPALPSSEGIPAEQRQLQRGEANQRGPWRSVSPGPSPEDTCRVPTGGHGSWDQGRQDRSRLEAFRGHRGGPAQWTLSWVRPHACPAAFEGQGGTGLHAHHAGPAPTKPTGKGASVGP